MVMTFNETTQLEEMKQNNKKELIDLQAKDRETEHNQKMERLNKLLEIAKAGGNTSME